MRPAGFKHTEETKRKTRLSLLGHPVSDETRKKMSKKKLGHTPWNKGTPMRKETKEKLSNSLKDRKLKNQIVIHHINGNHNDDRPENRIEITRSEHAKLHHQQRRTERRIK